MNDDLEVDSSPPQQLAAVQPEPTTADRALDSALGPVSTRPVTQFRGPLADIGPIPQGQQGKTFSGEGLFFDSTGLRPKPPVIPVPVGKDLDPSIQETATDLFFAAFGIPRKDARAAASGVGFALEQFQTRVSEPVGSAVIKGISANTFSDLSNSPYLTDEEREAFRQMQQEVSEDIQRLAPTAFGLGRGLPEEDLASMSESERLLTGIIGDFFIPIPGGAIAKLGGRAVKSVVRPLLKLESLPQIASGTDKALNLKRIATLRPIEAVADEVVTSTNPVVRMVSARTGINPSVLVEDNLGRLIVAGERQAIASEEITKVALSQLDAFGTRGRGNIPVPIKTTGPDRGFVGDTKKLWQDVFADDAVVATLSKPAQRYISTYREILAEIKELASFHGLKRTGILVAEDGSDLMWIPRQTKSIRGIELQKPSNPHLQRHYELATEGHAAGVRYDIDPRATLEVHLKATYREIANKQLSAALEPMSVPPSALIPFQTKVTRLATIRARDAAVRRVKNIVIQIRETTVKGKSVSAKRLQSARTRKLKSLNNQLVEANKSLDVATEAYNKAKFAHARARETAIKSEIGPGSLFGLAGDEIPIKTWRNRFFPREQAKQLEDRFGGFGTSGAKDNPFTKPVATLGNAIRFSASVGDFAAPFIQGQPVLAKNPLAWAKASVLHYYSFFDQTVQARYINKPVNRAAALDMARHGVPIGDTEFFAFVEKGGGVSLDPLFKRVPGGEDLKQLTKGLTSQTVGRFQASYNSFLTVARVELWKASRTGWKGDGDSLASHIRNLTGGLDSRALGVGPTQRSLESFWLAFSPRLLRSTTALGFDAMRPWTPKGRAALRVLATWAGIAEGLVFAANVAAGKNQEEIVDSLNPLSGKRYLSSQINGDWIGAGGQIRAIIQAAATLGELAASGDPSKFQELDPLENPLLNIWMSRGAPGIAIVGGAIEGLSGGEIDALPYDRIDSVPSLARHIGTSALPFTLQGRLEGEQELTSAFAITGLRTSAQTPSERRNDARDLAIEDLGFSGPYEDLAIDQQVKANNEPAVKAAQVEVNNLRRDRGSNYQAYIDRRDGLAQDKERVIGLAWGELGPGKQFRDRRTDLLEERAIQQRGLEAEFTEALAFIDALEPSTVAFDVALEHFLTTVQDPKLENEVTGEYDFNMRDSRIEALTEIYGEATIKRVEDFLRGDESPWDGFLREARETLRNYWDIADEYDKTHPQVRPIKNQIDKQRGPTGSVLDLQRWTNHPIWKARTRAISQQRLMARRANPRIDAMLVLWYGAVPQSAITSNLVLRLEAQYRESRENPVLETTKEPSS